MYDIDRYAHQKDYIVVSVQHNLNLDLLLQKMWEYLELLRIWTKPRGSRPEFTEPLILRKGATIEDGMAFLSISRGGFAHISTHSPP